MVNFNNETTVTTPPKDILQVIVLEARENTIIALEDYKKKELRGIEGDLSILYSRVGTWFLQHEGYLKRNIDPDVYNRMLNDLILNNNLSFNDIVKYILELNQIADKLELTKLDHKTKYNLRSWKSRNALKDV